MVFIFWVSGICMGKKPIFISTNPREFGHAPSISHMTMCLFVDCLFVCLFVSLTRLLFYFQYQSIIVMITGSFFAFIFHWGVEDVGHTTGTFVTKLSSLMIQCKT